MEPKNLHFPAQQRRVDGAQFREVILQEVDSIGDYNNRSGDNNEIFIIEAVMKG